MEGFYGTWLPPPPHPMARQGVLPGAADVFVTGPPATSGRPSGPAKHFAGNAGRVGFWPTAGTRKSRSETWPRCEKTGFADASFRFRDQVEEFRLFPDGRRMWLLLGQGRVGQTGGRAGGCTRRRVGMGGDGTMNFAGQAPSRLACWRGRSDTLPRQSTRYRMRIRSRAPPGSNFASLGGWRLTVGLGAPARLNLKNSWNCRGGSFDADGPSSSTR